MKAHPDMVAATVRRAWARINGLEQCDLFPWGKLSKSIRSNWREAAGEIAPHVEQELCQFRAEAGNKGR